MKLIDKFSTKSQWINKISIHLIILCFPEYYEACKVCILLGQAKKIKGYAALLDNNKCILFETYSSIVAVPKDYNLFILLDLLSLLPHAECQNLKV